MPTWRMEEMIFVVEVDIVLWYEDFALFGGVPRLVIPRVICINPSTTFYKALAAKGGDIIEGFFKFNFGKVDSEESCMLVHFSPCICRWRLRV